MGAEHWLTISITNGYKENLMDVALLKVRMLHKQYHVEV